MGDQSDLGEEGRRDQSDLGDNLDKVNCTSALDAAQVE